MKQCADCLNELPFSAFGTNSNGKHGLNTYCRECSTIRMRAWRARNLEKVKVKERRGHLKRKYGITLEEYNQLLHDQDGKCKLCGREQRQNRALLVDHSHSTGEVRGLLCEACNYAVYVVETFPEWTEQALTYLEKTR